MSGQLLHATRIVADVGGTNTRIALFDSGTGEYRHLSSYINREFLRFEDVLAQWLETFNEPTPDICCIAIAAPPSSDRVVMANMDWSFSCSELAATFGFTLRRLNDFEANAYALPHLTVSDRELLHSGSSEPFARLATVGPGTGLGGASLGWCHGSPVSIACEPGFMGLTPASALELDLFNLLQPRHGHIYAELLVSGPGLLRLYRALAEVTGQSPLVLDSAAISARALANEDSLCVLALETFSALFGSLCGDFLLANGSYGGLYLAGGIVPQMIPFLKKSSFHQRLIAKGAMQRILSPVPVYIITTAQPGLIGAAHVPL